MTISPPAGVTGVVHVGGGRGQEALFYQQQSLPVLWIEPLPANVAMIRQRIASIPNQIVEQALISDRDGERATFFVTSNSKGSTMSSSMLPLNKNRQQFLSIYTANIKQMTTTTLPVVMERHPNIPWNYLVVDVQGAELRVLNGAKPLIPKFRWILLEGSTVELYEGQPLIPELTEWLIDHGFHLVKYDLNRPEWHTDYLFHQSENPP